tara:strand:+ start:1392 stop:2480 length:1089 start_codon:yes stop_codon:yes gene_type:complete
MLLKKICKSLFREAGITINGTKDSDLIVKDDRFYTNVVFRGSIGLGEAYMNGWWDSKRLDKLMYLLFKNELELKLRISFVYLLHNFVNIFSNPISKSSRDILSHYDKDEELFESMLDKNMMYTGGYWKNAKNLEQSQINKFELICKKLKLKKGMTVLDIGCGFGGFAKYVTKKYGVKVTGITISKLHASYAKRMCKGLSVEIKLEDYRNHNGKYDAIVSFGMFEHVGLKYHKIFMKKVRSFMKENSIFLLETLGLEKSRDRMEPWLEKYIFPGALIPSIKQITDAADGIFIIEDLQNLGKDYGKSLMEWHKNFATKYKKGSLKFRRMWEFYLLSSAGATRSHRYQNYQIIFTKYKSDIGYIR